MLSTGWGEQENEAVATVLQYITYSVPDQRTCKRNYNRKGCFILPQTYLIYFSNFNFIVICTRELASSTQPLTMYTHRYYILPGMLCTGDYQMIGRSAKGDSGGPVFRDHGQDNFTLVRSCSAGRFL